MTENVSPDLWIAALLDRALMSGQAIETTPDAYAELLAAWQVTPAEVRWFGENHRAELQPAVDEVVERVRLDAVVAPPLQFVDADLGFVLMSVRWHERNGSIDRAVERLRYCRAHAVSPRVVEAIDVELERLVGAAL